MRHCLVRSVAVAVFAAALVSARPVFAGPPLLCHPFDIGTERSLPWDGTSGWFDADDRYDVAMLVRDTQALLTPSTPVVVRMETLRRAAVYASTQEHAASKLLSALRDRVRIAEQSGKADALALHDLAYLTEAYRQIGIIARTKQAGLRAARLDGLVKDADGYALVRRAVSLRPDDPALEFSAALIASDKDRGAYTTHAAKARAGAKQDALLARNLKQLT